MRQTTRTSASWQDGALHSPQTGLPLYREGPFLSNETESERWPVVEEIPYLRAGREWLVERANNLLERGEERAALVELLRDQDDWAPSRPPGPDEAERAVEAADAGRSARETMSLLGFGAVADYFAYRLSDPTYLAGLALIQEHWNAPRSSFELACGIGHYTRELLRRGVDASAGDVVFAKLWLARRYLVPEARLVCFDASRGFPLPDDSADLVLCQDAFYFLPEKPHVAAELGRIAGDPGTIVIGHSHNAEVENLSAGEPVGPARHLELFPGAELYADEDLTQAVVSGETPRPRSVGELSGTEAVCLARVGSGGQEAGEAPDLLLSPVGTPLYPNPLYERKETERGEKLTLGWPSERYREEYGPRSTYLPEEVEVQQRVLNSAASQGVGASAEVDRLARLRVLLDLPGGL